MFHNLINSIQYFRKNVEYCQEKNILYYKIYVNRFTVSSSSLYRLHRETRREDRETRPEDNEMHICDKQ